MEVYHLGLEMQPIALKSILSHNNSYATVECVKWKQLEEEVISPWFPLFILYIYQCICIFLSTQSCMLWLSCYSTSLPAEEVFLSTSFPLPSPQLSLLPTATSVTGQGAAAARWLGSAGPEQEEGRESWDRGEDAIHFWWFWDQLMPKP